MSNKNTQYFEANKTSELKLSQPKSSMSNELNSDNVQIIQVLNLNKEYDENSSMVPNQSAIIQDNYSASAFNELNKCKTTETAANELNDHNSQMDTNCSASLMFRKYQDGNRKMDSINSETNYDFLHSFNMNKCQNVNTSMNLYHSMESKTRKDSVDLFSINHRKPREFDNSNNYHSRVFYSKEYKLRNHMDIRNNNLQRKRNFRNNNNVGKYSVFPQATTQPPLHRLKPKLSYFDKQLDCRYPPPPCNVFVTRPPKINSVKNSAIVSSPPDALALLDLLQAGTNSTVTLPTDK